MKFRPTLFWDTNVKNIDPVKNARYIIERVLEYGRDSEARWVFEHYSKDEIRKVINLPRVQLSPRSKALWSLMVK